MAKSRSQQRAAAKARQRAKQERLEARAQAYRNQVIRETIRANMDNPPERNYYPTQSCIAGFAGKLHAAKEYSVGGRDKSGLMNDRQLAGFRKTLSLKRK